MTLTPYQRHVREWSKCRRCRLCTQRRRVVLARGRVPAPVLFVGEAPGASEDVLGKPFCGPAGHLMDRIINLALDGQHDYALTNLVACYPKKAKEAGTNEPEEKEITACAPRLKEFVQICKPRAIITVGRLAAKHIYWDHMPTHGTFNPDWLRPGKFIEFREIIHPAAILRLDVSQQGLAIQRCVAAIEDAVEGLP